MFKHEDTAKECNQLHHNMNIKFCNLRIQVRLYWKRYLQDVKHEIKYYQAPNFLTVLCLIKTFSCTPTECNSSVKVTTFKSYSVNYNNLDFVIVLYKYNRTFLSLIINLNRYWYLHNLQVFLHILPNWGYRQGAVTNYHIAVQGIDSYAARFHQMIWVPTPPNFISTTPSKLYLLSVLYIWC